MAGIKQAAMGKKKQMDKTRKDYAAGAEFELEDSNDEGDRLPLAVREALPVCITLHIVRCPLAPFRLVLWRVTSFSLPRRGTGMPHR